MATQLETGIDWGTQLPDNQISYFFAPTGGVYASPVGNVTSSGFVPYEEQQFRLAFALFESILNVDFVEVSNATAADFILISYAGGNDGDLGAFGPPGTSTAGTGVFNWQGSGWDWDSPNSGALEKGGYGFVTIIHELGHGLGLAHPHDNGGSSTIFPGVSGAFGDYGDFDLNQGVWTMMSYNDGWQTNPSGRPPPASSYGYEGTPMAIDIAVLQAKYGANTSYHTGNDTYVLPTSNGLGTFYSCLWDAGGVDTIAHNGSAPALIDLRPATLQVEEGGGGFLSYVDGIFGGFTIARGVVIENATGGSGSDALIGNAAANVLDGAGGDDIMRGLGGDDTYFVDDAGDVVDESAAGSAGTDTIQSTISFNLGDAAHAQGSIENLTLLAGAAINGSGNELANTIVGNSGANRLSGGLGKDSLTGGAAFDAFVFDAKPRKVNADHLTDLHHGTDEIWLDKSVFTKLKIGELKKSAFYAHKNADEAEDSNDRIVYDSKSGECYYDRDGLGGKKAKLFAIIDDSPNNLSHGDFLVVA